MDVITLLEKWRNFLLDSQLTSSEHRRLKLDADTDEIELLLKNTNSLDKVHKAMEKRGIKRSVVEGAPVRLLRREFRVKDQDGTEFIAVVEGES